VPAADGRFRVVDIRGGLGGNVAALAAHGARLEIRDRLVPYLQQLGELANGKRILFLSDPFNAGHTFPDDFFNYVQRYASYGPVTDWVPDLAQARRMYRDTSSADEVEEIARHLDPLAVRLRLPLGYCAGARVELQEGSPKLLLSGYRERGRQQPQSVVLAPEDVGALVFGGRTERFPDDLRQQPWFPVLNPPVFDRLLESRWLVAYLLEGTKASELLPRWLPVGMGLRTSEEIRHFAASLQAAGGFPVAVLKPSQQGPSSAVRFLDRTALRALAARQPERRLPLSLAEALYTLRLLHSYEEISAYRGKLLDNLLRTRGAAVHDHGDGTFHFSAPYPFLENTVAVLQEYIEARPIRSRRTGELHRGQLRVVLWDDRLVAAVYRLERERDDGTFRDLARPEVKVFYEPVSGEEEELLKEQVVPFFAELRRQFTGRVQSLDDLDRLCRRWVQEQTDLS
jgi:hypothetical protein